MGKLGKGQKPIGYRPPEVIDKIIKDLITVSGHAPATIVGMLVAAQLKTMCLLNVPEEELEPLENFKILIEHKKTKPHKVKKTTNH